MISRKVKYGLALSSLFAVYATTDIKTNIASASDKVLTTIDAVSNPEQHSFLNSECDYKASAGDLTDKELANGKILPASCYQNALYYGRKNAVQAVEYGFQKHNADPALAQDIRNKALLYMARVHPRTDTLDLAYQHGADFDIKDKKGRGIEEIIINRGGGFSRSKVDMWKILYHLHQNYQRDLGFLKADNSFFWSLAAESDLPNDEERVIKTLEEIRTVLGYDPQKLEDSSTGLNLLHLAARSGSRILMEYIRDHGLYFNPWDKRGYHALDYAAPQFAAIMRTDFGVRKENRPVQNSIASTGAFIRSYLQTNSRQYLDLAGQEEDLIRPASDFTMYDPVTYDHNAIFDNSLDPALIISEYAAFSFDGGEHIEDTSRIAMAVSHKLGSPTWKDVIAIEENISVHNSKALTTILKLNLDDYVIISNSVGQRIDDDPEKEYRSGFSYSLRYTSDLDKINYIYYNSAGNNGTDACLSIDNVPFCMQNGPVTYHPVNAVRVGAARTNDNGDIVVEYYSDKRPAFCAMLPYEEGELYKGTSFSAPAAAAVEERLADIFARSDIMPEGVVHEDILMALMLTAQANELHDDKTGDVIPVFQNTAGIELNNRCGTGVIQEQKAADLLTKMVRWTRDNPGITPTQARSIRLEVDTTKRTIDNGRYVYTVKVPQDGILTQFRAALAFHDNNKGAALIQINNLPPVPLDLAPSGLTTEFRFAGHSFKAGDEIRIITTKPLQKKEWDWQHSGTIDLRIVQPNSPIAKAIQETTTPPVFLGN